MDFIRINDNRVKLSHITSYCEMQNRISEEELASAPAHVRERYEKLRYSLSIFCDGARNSQVRGIFNSEEELQAALARLDAALPKFFRVDEWRVNLSQIVSLGVENDPDEEDQKTILLHTERSTIHVRAHEEQKRNEILARIDAALESL